MVLLYLDSSALFKRYRTEPGTATMNALFGQWPQKALFLSSRMATVEIEAAASRGLRGKVINQKDYGLILSSAAEDLDRITILPVSADLIDDAAQEARHRALRALDAIHLASAVRTNRAVSERFVFVSSDKELLQAAGDAGFVTLDPEDPKALEQLRTVRDQ